MAKGRLVSLCPDFNFFSYKTRKLAFRIHYHGNKDGLEFVSTATTQRAGMEKYWDLVCFAFILFSWTYIQKACGRHSSGAAEYYSCLQCEFIKWAFVRHLQRG